MPAERVSRNERLSRVESERRLIWSVRLLRPGALR
jgi:hypothetical protein